MWLFNNAMRQKKKKKKNSLDAHLRQWQYRKHQYPNNESHTVNISRVFRLH